MHHPSRDIDSVLVVTTPGALYQWEAEIKANAPWPGPILVADGDAKSRQYEFNRFLSANFSARNRQANERSPICWFIVTHQSLRLSLDAFKKELEIVGPEYYPAAIILDEAHRIKDHKALVTKALLSLRKYFRCRAALTATPATEHEPELWSQCLFLDDGERLGSGYWGFMRRFFDPDSRGWKWVLKHRAASAIRSRLSTLFHFVPEKKVFADMPSAVYTTVKVPLSPAAALAYQTLAKDWEIAGKGLKWILEKKTAQQAVANGFAVITKDNGKRYRIDYGTRKPQVLFDFLSDKFPGEPAVVFCKFLYDIERLRKMAKDKEIPFASITGSVSGAQRFETVRSLMTQTGTRILAIQTRCAESLDGLQKASRLFLFYSSPQSLAARIQAEGRGIRQGQRRTVYFVDFISKGTIEEEILQSFRNKTDIIRALTPALLGRRRYGNA